MPETVARTDASDPPRVGGGHIFFEVAQAIRPIYAVVMAGEEIHELHLSDRDDLRCDREDWAGDVARIAGQSFADLRKEYEGRRFAEGAETLLTEAECRILAIQGLAVAAKMAASYGPTPDASAPFPEYVAALSIHATETWEWLGNREVWGDVYDY